MKKFQHYLTRKINIVMKLTLQTKLGGKLWKKQLMERQREKQRARAQE